MQCPFSCSPAFLDRCLGKATIAQQQDLYPGRLRSCIQPHLPIPTPSLPLGSHWGKEKKKVEPSPRRSNPAQEFTTPCLDIHNYPYITQTPATRRGRLSVRVSSQKTFSFHLSLLHPQLYHPHSLSFGIAFCTHPHAFNPGVMRVKPSWKFPKMNSLKDDSS